MKKYICAFGFYKLGSVAYNTGASYYNQFQLKPEYKDRIRNTYNSSGKQWAVVTGASEGIGRCYALDLARSGFNVVLVSRSMTKLEKV